MDQQLRNKIAKRAEVLTTLKQDLISRLDLPYELDDLHEDVSLLGSGLGLDSLDALEVILGIENAFGVKIPEDNIEVLRSINTVADFILARKDEEVKS